MHSIPFTLHHIGILVRDIPAAVQTYQARFGYRVLGATVHDPVQTAHVQFLEGATPEVLIELISPDGRDSKLTGALKKGGGLNHLAYSSDAIEDDCRTLRSSGMLLLHAPVAAQAFPGRRIAWLMGRDGIPVELVEKNPAADLRFPAVSLHLPTCEV